MKIQRMPKEVSGNIWRISGGKNLITCGKYARVIYGNVIGFKTAMRFMNSWLHKNTK